tara:strand:- start:471 stop:1259 length:789 start_codon:yes stop_codon:yes gene_type:complete
MLIHHGVRGSIPCANFETSKYGGNTPCVEIKTHEAQIIFDCGSGFSKVELVGETPTIIFLSHFHHDHIQGLPFNDFNLKNQKPIYLTSGICKKEILKKNLQKYLSPPFFPIDFIEQNKLIKFVEFPEISSMYKEFNFDKIELNHPGKASGYSLNLKNKKFCYLLDNEYENFQEKELLQFCKDSDTIIWDGMYTEKELKTKKGWGHSSIEEGMNFGAKIKVKNLIISHHSPLRTDKELDEIKLKYSATNLLIASENEKLDIYG